jgi:PII-like signaling protein
MRIFIGEDQKYGKKLLYEAIAKKARTMGMAGVTVLRGLLGYAAQGKIRTFKVLRLSDDLPVVIEIVDTDEKIQAFTRAIAPMINKGMATFETVEQIVFNRLP